MPSNFKLKRVSDGEEFELSEISLLVGRSESCDIQVTQGHPSREHARVAERDGKVLVQDLHSTNGTFVNNTRIETSAALDVGDVVKFGDEAFSVQSIAAPEATVLMRSLGDNANVSTTVIDDEDDEEDEDSTSFLQVYSLPAGWNDSENFAETVGKLDDKKRQAIDRYLERFSQSIKGKTGIFFILFSDDDPPIIKSLVIRDDKRQWTFGRSSDQDIVFEHACISKHHANITYGSDGWTIEDVGSTNGMSLNGRPEKKINLRDDMVLEISRVEVLVRFVK